MEHIEGLIQAEASSISEWAWTSGLRTARGTAATQPNGLGNPVNCRSAAPPTLEPAWPGLDRSSDERNEQSCRYGRNGTHTGIATPDSTHHPSGTAPTRTP